MNRISKSFTAAVAAAAIVAGIAGVAGADTSTSDTDIPITGEALELATAAALAETGGGEVTETEIDDEDSKYEVEITMDDGTIFEVQLDANFDIVSVEDETNEGPDND